MNRIFRDLMGEKAGGDFSLEAQKNNIIQDYKAWVELALEEKTDNVGIVNISVHNFEHKLNILLKKAKEGT